MAEILSPAGGPEQLFAAVQSGADAVYLGLKRFSARGSAVNFDEQQLKEAVSFCHQRGVKVYAAVNTMLFDGELPDCAETLRILCETGVDAAIVQDPAIAELAQSCCPELELHASTQMTLHTAEGCEFARRLGYTRTVLSRELPADVIKELCKLQNMEIEIFVHGALCMSVSGQCLMSAVVGGRSANRGICAQPCRLPCSVKKGRQDHALSLKDMSILRDLPKLAEFGVDSMKIEGRMKRPEYAALSANCAKKALAGEDYDERLLADVFSRGGFTDGYLKRRTGEYVRDMAIMDAAKAIAFCTVNAGDVSDYIFGKKQGAGALPIVLLPTTCGTGSEGNQIAVLTNPETKDKKALYTMQVMPRVSVIDPDVMTTMPKSVLSSVGFDAFTHSLEAYTSKKANPITDAQALLGMQLLADDLPKLVSGEGGAAEWEAVSLAATLGGMVIGAAGVSAAHGMEHPASGLKNIVHGRGLAALTPPIVERLAPADPVKFARVSVLLGGSGAEDCAESIRRFLKAIDLSVKLSDLGITAEDVPWMTENCMKISIGNLKNAPVTFSREEVEQIYREAL